QSRGPTELPVLTMVTGYSRWLSAVLIPSRRVEDLFAGWWQLIHALGAVPRTLVWDGEGAIGRWRAGRAELTADCQGFRGTLGTKAVICRPADPEAKGIIEPAHDYLERSVLPGRTVTSPGAVDARVWAKHQSLSGPEHVAAAKALRRERQGLRVVPIAPVPQARIETPAGIGGAGGDRVDVQVRDLSDYDQALGVQVTDGGVA